MKDKLTIKQEKFAQKYVELGNASEAYRQSHNTEKMKEKQVWEEASKLKSNPKVAQRIEELQAQHQKRHEVTVDTLTEEYDQVRKLSIYDKQYAAANTAIAGKAKLHGLDKSEPTPAENMLMTLLGKIDGLTAKADEHR